MMSRIDISVTEKESGELIANRGFCRSSHLSYFCEESQDSAVRDLAENLFLGQNITEDNIDDFLRDLEYVISYFLEMNENERAMTFPSYKNELFIQFVDDLKNSLVFLSNLNQEKKLSEIEVEIV